MKNKLKNIDLDFLRSLEKEYSGIPLEQRKIAELTGLSRKNVYDIIDRAIKKMRKEYKGKTDPIYCERENAWTRMAVVNGFNKFSPEFYPKMFKHKEPFSHRFTDNSTTINQIRNGK